MQPKADVGLRVNKYNTLLLAYINHNLVTEESWTCGRYNTVNGEVSEYLLPVQRGSGENRCGSRGPLEFNPASSSRGSHNSITTRPRFA